MSCPHCGHDTDPGEDECPLCGTPLDGGGEAESGREAGGRTPWEEDGRAAALVDSWWESLSDPRRFFSRLDWEGGLERPLLYYLLFVVAGAGFGLLWSFLLTPVLASALDVDNLLPAVGGGALLLQQFFLTPFKALFWLAVFTGAAHLVVRVLAERPRPIGATARALCYSAGPQLLQAVPLLGGLVAVVWSAVLAVVGVRTAHRTGTGRAVGALAAAFFVYVTMAILWSFVVRMSGLGGSLLLSPQ